MKRKNNNIDNQISKIKFKKLSFDYYLPHNTGLCFNRIEAYRVIYGDEKNDYHYDFITLNEAKEFINSLNFDDKSFIVIRCIVYQDSFYLEDDNGKVKDSNTNKLYTFINRSRFCEWDLDKINYIPNLLLFS